MWTILIITSHMLIILCVSTQSTFSAKDVVFGAIAAGKHVVTANKALIAAFLPELQAALLANPTVR